MRKVIALLAAIIFASPALLAGPIIYLPNVGPGAGTIGGSGNVVASVTLDAKGRVTAATTAAGATTSTLPTSYSAGSAGPQALALDSTRLGLRIKDNSTPISGNLFDVTNSTGGTVY